MINYNPKEWFTFIFRIHRADTVRKLFPLMLAVSAYAAAVAFLELEYWKLAETSHIKNISLMHGILGFVISLLLVFRTNTAYDRWWEGRKQWGALTNVSRNFAIKLSAFFSVRADRDFFNVMIANYSVALKNHLRENENNFEIDPVLDLHLEKHGPNQIAKAIFDRINELHKQKVINTEQLIILNTDFTAFTDICGACERIKNTPIPFSYSVFIKKFIFFFVMTLPFGWVFSLGYFVIPVVVLILYVFASLELIAEEIENPFGTDANDLPIDAICVNIKKHENEIFN
jgi:putative membrane protein